MDVDGTLTDGKIYMGSNGEVCKAFNIKDGYGIRDMAMPRNIVPIIITGRKSDIVIKRCKELCIEEVYQGISNKIEKVKEVVEDLSIVAYIGDDINDLECMTYIKQAGGLIGCPADAAKNIKEMADFVSEYSGGNGAVRDFIEWIIYAN